MNMETTCLKAVTPTAPTHIDGQWVPRKRRKMN